MMYSNKFAVAIKDQSKKVLKEFGDTVYLPFNTEYSILLKNLNNRRAVAKITIDGENVSGGGIVVPSNGSVDLERFVESVNKFKFIERIEAIEKHRGIKVDDGIIRIEFSFEKQRAYTEFMDYSPTRGISKSVSFSCSSNDAGITGKGSHSDQTFNRISVDLEDESHVIILRIKGETPDNYEVRNPVTVKSYKKCDKCGTKNDLDSKYCKECTNSLINY